MTSTGLWLALRSYYRDSDQKGSRWSLKPRSNIRDFTVEMPFKALYQYKRIADWSINVRTDLSVVVVEHLHSFGRMACNIVRCLFFLLIVQWLPLEEASHFRHGLIMWAPADSYSNTVRTDYSSTATY